ncbi:transposase, partial [Mycobacterium canetti]|uniref:transposase n=1 Tax=Mycobacterium canetti TaxID=78331 RepID=UPI001E586F97
LTVVVDHDSGRLVWAAPGHDKATLGLFFDALGAERAAQITHVSADAADLTVVVDHDSGRLVWAAPGHDKATLGLFFDALGAERA